MNYCFSGIFIEHSCCIYLLDYDLRKALKRCIFLNFLKCLNVFKKIFYAKSILLINNSNKMIIIIVIYIIVVLLQNHFNDVNNSDHGNSAPLY